MKRSKYFLFLVMALLAAISVVAVACGDDDDDDDSATSTPGGTAAAATFPADSTMAKIVGNGKIVIGVKFDQPGFGFKDPVTGKVDGFDVAVGKEIAKALGLKENQVEFVEAVSRNRVPFLQEDKVDLIIATMTINEERKQQIDFSRPYYLAGQSILVKKDNTAIKSVNDLNGKKVCTAQGSTSAQNLAQKAPQSDPLLLDAYGSCVSALKDGRVEAVTTDDIILAGFAKEDSSLKLVGGQFTQEPYGIGIKKGKDDLVQFVNDTLNKMLQDGTWTKIYEQYLGGVEGLPKPDEAKNALPASV